jgi:hypothetical protein
MADPQPPTQQQPPPPQQPPQWAPPQQQPPAWGAPPPGQWGGQQGYGSPPPRPIGVTIGSIWLILVGILQVLAGAGCGLLGAGASSQSGQDPTGLVGVLGGSLLIFGGIAVVLGILQLASGAGALGGRGWARWIGIVVSIMYFLVGILILLGSFGAMSTEGGGGPTSLIFALIWLIGYGFTVYAYITASAFFSYRR